MSAESTAVEAGASPSKGSLPAWLFPSLALAAVALHALRLFQSPGLHGGVDLLAHLRMTELMGQAPALRNVYPPGYHAIGALLSPWVGLAAFPKLFAVVAAALSIGAFRFFQRSTGLPEHAALLFALWPYSFSLSWTLPKIEVGGYLLIFLALGLMVRRRYAAVGLLVAASFWLHTGTALVLGVCGGTLALARRDVKALVALALGTLGAVPLVWAHLAAGCTFQQALLFAEGNYLHDSSLGRSLDRGLLTLALASPPMLGAALLGASETWRRHRSVALLCAVVTLLYLQDLWLAPFGIATTFNLIRGLAMLSLPASVAAGVYLARRPRVAPWLLAAAALWCLGTTFTVAKDPLFWRPMAVEEIRGLQMSRCQFGWNAPNAAHRQRKLRDRAGTPERP
jgi:hypothetical protein